MSTDLIHRANGASSPVVRARSSSMVRRLEAEAGVSIIASDLNRLVASRALQNAESYVNEVIRADSRVAGAVEDAIQQHPEIGKPLLADTVAEYARVKRSISERHFLG